MKIRKVDNTSFGLKLYTLHFKEIGGKQVISHSTSREMPNDEFLSRVNKSFAKLCLERIKKVVRFKEEIKSQKFTLKKEINAKLDD